jgi:hypothetical protein
MMNSTTQSQSPMKFRFPLIAVLLLLALLRATSNAQSVIYDVTVEAELADVPGVVRMSDHQHLWQLDKDGNLPRTKHWDAAFAAVAAGKDVTLGIEPDTNAQWPMPTDPRFASLEEIAKTHRILAQQLEPLCQLAQKTGAKVWVYRFLSPTHKRVEHIVNQPDAWQADVKALVNLAYNDQRKTIAKLLASTGGGELCHCYVPSGWNGPQGWQVAKCVLLVERQQATLAALGVNSLPLLHPFAIGDRKPVKETVWRAMVFAATRRGQAAVWSGPNHRRDKDGKITGAWYPVIPAQLKVGLR